MTLREHYVKDCRVTAADLGDLAIATITSRSAGNLARAATRNAFVAMGLRANCAAGHPVDVSFLCVKCGKPIQDSLEDREAAARLGWRDLCCYCQAREHGLPTTIAGFKALRQRAGR